MILALLLFSAAVEPRVEQVPGLRAEVEILVDKWGVPHIYAANTHDLFFAQGWTAARDRLFQIDAWRRTGTGRWAEVRGPSALRADRFARLVRYRGDPQAEWSAYHPEARSIAEAFTAGINAYIRGLKQRPPEFERAGYDPGLWSPEDVTARIAGLVMMRNLNTEVSRAIAVSRLGLEGALRRAPLDPPVRPVVAEGIDLAAITPDILDDYLAVRRATGAGDGDSIEDEGSNNWVVHGSRTATGKPILANDPHRPILVPSLRKTVHLAAPGWNAIGAGEPALPGIALGHNEEIGFGFTIVGIDQMDLVVETLNPANLDEYRDRGRWRRMEVERQRIAVKGRLAETVELRYTVRGPVLHLDGERKLAYVLRWIGSEPGAAGYLPALRLSQARNWSEFLRAAEHYKVPSENLVYADRAGNIGWIAAGAAPLRKGYEGLLPVPGGDARYDWMGILPLTRHPQSYNPASGWIATANHNILPKGFAEALGFEFALPYRYQRIAEVLPGIQRHTIEDSIRLQQDIVSIAGRRFLGAVRKAEAKLSGPAADLARMLAGWDARMDKSSRAAAVFAVWLAAAAQDGTMETALQRAESSGDGAALLNDAAGRAWRLLEERLGEDSRQWRWGGLHQVRLRDSIPTSGHSTTVNAASGAGFRHASGASFRQILDLADWDRSVMTNVPGESGDPASEHAFDLTDDWLSGRYHPLPYTRKAVEAATKERVLLRPYSARK